MHTIMRDILFQYMSPLFITLICIGIVIVALLLVLIFRKQDKDEEQDQSFLLLQDQLEKLRATVEGKLERSQTDLHQALHRQNTESTRLIQEITKELTEVKEGNKQVFSMTEQLQNPDKVLTHQKQRANIV